MPRLQLLLFNWATAFSPWKPRDIHRGPAPNALQLGHGIFAVETDSIKCEDWRRFSVNVGERCIRFMLQFSSLR